MQYNHCIAEILGWKEAGLKENCIAIQLGVLQEVADFVKGIVLQHSGLRWAVSKVYCNTGRLGLECIAIQLSNLYCEEAWPVSRYSGLGNWARGWARVGRAGTTLGVLATGVAGARGRRSMHRQTRRWARKAGTLQRHAGHAGRAQQGCGRLAAWALGSRPGR